MAYVSFKNILLLLNAMQTLFAKEGISLQVGFAVVHSGGEGQGRRREDLYLFGSGLKPSGKEILKTLIVLGCATRMGCDQVIGHEIALALISTSVIKHFPEFDKRLY
jgi:hypothetical protein